MITIKHAGTFNPIGIGLKNKDVAVKEVGIGIPKAASYEKGKKIADVAFMQEFGDGKILPRPFVRNAISQKRGEWRDTALRELRQAVREKKSIKEALLSIGDKVKRDVVQSLDTLTEPELKPTTVESKRRKGRRNPSKPLIDSGKMRDSFKVEVR